MKKSLAWLALLTAVVLGFFHETVFRGYSLVPVDLLHQLILPYAHSVREVSVQNHYAIDALTADYGWGVFWQQSVRNGELPLWNPYIFGGHPHLASSMPAALSPFRLLYLFLPAERAFSLGIVLQILLAGIFMFAFLRELGRSHCASFVGGCAFALNSAFLMWYWRVPGPLAWVPLVLLLFERSLRLNSWRYALGAGVALAMSALSGNIQALAHVGFLCACYFAATFWWRNRSPRTVATAAVIVVIAGLVAAAQLLPTAELLLAEGGGSQFEPTRAHANPSVRHTLLGIPALVTLIFPGLPGSPESFDLMKLAQATMAGFTGYIGLIPFVMFVIGAVCVREWRVKGLLWIIAAVLVIVFFTPLLKYLYHRFFIVMIFAACVIAAYGADVLLAGDDRRMRRIFTVMLAVCALLAVGLIVAQIVIHWKRAELLRMGETYVLGRASETAFSSNKEWLVSRVSVFLDHYRISNVVFWLPVACLAGLVILRKRFPQPALVAFTVLDLAVLGRFWVPQVDLNKNPLFPPVEVLAPAQADPDLFRVRQFSRNWLVLPNSLLMHYGLSSYRGNESLWPLSIDALPALEDGRFNEWLDVQNVKYLITESSTDLSDERFELVAESGGVRLFRNNHCRPRLRLEPAGKVELKWYKPRSVAVKVECAEPARLVLADTYYPGWRARLDDQPVPVERADRVLRAVAVPAGTHEVEFYYAPLSVRVGATISLLTLAGLLAFAVRRKI